MQKNSYFKKLKFVFDGSLYFIHLNLARYINYLSPPPLLVNIEITKRCNLRCIHCDIRQIPETYPEIINEELSTSDIKELVDSLKSMGTKYISISGGEPFLRKDIFEVIKYIKNKDMGIHISSNGALITKEIAKRVNDMEVNAISISLEATTPELHDKIRGVNGAFNMALRGIRNLIEFRENTQVGISPIITDLNLNELPKMVGFAHELRVDAIRFQPWHISLGHIETEKMLNIKEDRLEHLNNTIEEIIQNTKRYGIYTNSDTYLRGVKRYFQNRRKIDVECFAGSFTCNISWCGDVVPCSTAFMSVIGNIKNKPFKDLWNSQQFKDARKVINKGNCPKCWMGCFIEPSLRCSLKYAIKNPINYINDLRFYYRSV